MEYLSSIVGNLLPKTKEELQLEEIAKDKIGHDVYFLLLECADDFFRGDAPQSLAKSEELLHLIWEKLNTGHWKDVDIAWRHVYTYCSLLKAMSLCSRCDGKEETEDASQAIAFEKALKACDMGLLMGAPVLGNILSRLATAIQGAKKTTHESIGASMAPSRAHGQSGDEPSPALLPVPVVSKRLEIPRVTCPSLLCFQSRHMRAKTPVIIQGAMEHWPALGARKWSLSYLREVAGGRTVPIEVGAKYTDESWSQSLMTISDFITKYIEGKGLTKERQVGYLAQHQLFYQIPELRDDICIPDYCCLHDDQAAKDDHEASGVSPGNAVDDDDHHDDDDDDSHVDINAWFGPAGTISPLHTDPKHNCLAQVVGEKFVRLYGEDMTPHVYPHADRLLHNTSQVDVENPDEALFPLFSSAVYQEVILRQGEMLYIPPGCWHYVRSLSTSFSVSFWWT